MSPAKKQQKPPRPKAKPKVKTTSKKAAAAQTSPAKAKAVAPEVRPKKGDKGKPVITKAAEEEAGGDSPDDLEAALSDMLGEESYGEEENGEEEDMHEPDDEVEPEAFPQQAVASTLLCLAAVFSRRCFLVALASVSHSLLLRFNFPRSLLLAATSLVLHAQHSRFSGVSLHEVAYEPFVGGALAQAGSVSDVSDAQSGVGDACSHFAMIRFGYSPGGQSLKL